MSCFQIASLNLNGARERAKRAMLFETMKEKAIGVASVQETHTDASNSADWVLEFGGLSVLSHHTSTSAILFSSSCIPCSFEVEEVVKGRILKVCAQYDNIFLFLFVFMHQQLGGRE